MKSGNEKILGGLGCLFVILSAIPGIGWILGIAGFTLVILAFNEISKKTNNPAIFQDILISLILAMAGLLLGILFVVPSFISIIFGHGSGFIGLLLGFGIMYALAILSYSKFRKALKIIANLTGVSLFETAGTMFFIGAITLIIFIGNIILYVAWILLTIAFFSIPDEYKTHESSS